VNDVADKPHVLAARAIALAEDHVFSRLSVACSSRRDRPDPLRPAAARIKGIGYCRNSENAEGLCLPGFCPLLKDA
jgi:hypothetical protein